MKKSMSLLVLLMGLFAGLWAETVFDEGFETGNTNAAAPVGWIVDATGIVAGNGPLTYGREPHSGDWYVYQKYGTNKWMYKEMNLVGGTTYKFSVWHKADTATGATFEVKYGTAATTDGMTEVILPMTTAGVTYQETTATFTPATSGVYFIGIHGILTYTPWYLNLDDIKVATAPTTPEFIATPTSNDFGRILSGNSSADKVFTIKNNGAGTLNISSSSLIGDNMDQFVLTDTNTYPVALTAGQSINVSVKFAPTVAGSKTANLHIVADAKVDHDIALTGIAERVPFFVEKFDAATWAPTNWTTVVTITAKSWKLGNPSTNPFIAIDPSNVTSAVCPYSAATEIQNEWLISPAIDLTNQPNAEINFYAGFGREYLPGGSGAGALGADLIFKVSSNGGTDWTDVWKATTDTDPNQAWAWRNINVPNINTYGNSLKFAWVVAGSDGDLIGLDGVRIAGDGGSSIEDGLTSSKSAVLAQNYPNPFNPETTINFSLANSSTIKLAVYNAKGEFVKELISGVQTAGNHSVKFNAAGMNSGVYFYKLTTPERTLTQKMLLVK